MVPVISIVGRSGTGKTTLLEKLIKELTRRGYTIGTVKHDVHGFEVDRPGKDSWRHREAGASTVVLSSPDKMAVIKGVTKEWTAGRIIAAFMSDVDLVVTEGYKSGDFPKIEVLRKEVSRKPVCAGDELLLAFASDFKIRGKKPVYGLEDFLGVSDLIEEKVIRAHKAKTVSLVVDGKPVPLKPFIEDLLREGVLGMITSLKGCGRPREIEIRVRKK